MASETVSHPATTSERKRARKPRAVPQRVTGKVLSFVPRHRGPVVEHDTVRALEFLLRAARLGKIDGIAFSCLSSGRGGPSKGIVVDTCGVASRDPDIAVQLAKMLFTTVLSGGTANQRRCRESHNGPKEIVAPLKSA